MLVQQYVFTVSTIGKLLWCVWGRVNVYLLIVRLSRQRKYIAFEIRNVEEREYVFNLKVWPLQISLCYLIKKYLTANDSSTLSFFLFLMYVGLLFSSNMILCIFLWYLAWTSYCIPLCQSVQLNIYRLLRLLSEAFVPFLSYINDTYVCPNAQSRHPYLPLLCKPGKLPAS